MALTAPQKQKIAKMFGRPATVSLITAQITAMGATYTSDVETDIIAEIARWDAGVGTGVVWFEGTESNEGFNMSATVTGGNPVHNIAVLLEWPYHVGPQTMGSLAIG